MKFKIQMLRREDFLYTTPNFSTETFNLSPISNILSMSQRIFGRFLIVTVSAIQIKSVNNYLFQIENRCKNPVSPYMTLIREQLILLH
ncbi:hypothetical protein FGO68_gene15785 [Halteria grandinella]|uniref:Uncharacterized protein n=1 Tax=Halteria grandinella TaxID=5974 RepID=A0A8J8N8V8_HALGN|nr:hypothetical protein FGO68_gene15785 [Halteria grandinella]